MALQGAYAGEVSCVFNSVNMGGRNIGLSERIRRADTTTVADSYETFITTIKGADVSVDTPYDTANTVTIGTKGWLVVEVANAIYVVGTGECTDRTRTSPVGDAAAATYSIAFNGSFWQTP